MPENCNHDCSACNNSCSNKMPETLKPNNNSKIKYLLAVVSGKGGVGKSSSTALIAHSLNKAGLKVGILDADLTGPSIPKIFGIHGKANANNDGLNPITSKNGIKIMSINLLLDSEDSPVAWRGPIISGVLNQFFTEVNWGNIDILLIDMPPGTSDVFLTIFNMLPINDIVTITTPSELVRLIVGKASNLVNTMKKNTLALIENMAYFECDECKKKHYIFGNPSGGNICKKYGIKTLIQLPIDPKLAKLIDAGKIENYDTKNKFDKLIELIKNQIT